VVTAVALARQELRQSLAEGNGRRLAVVWGLLYLNVLTFAKMPMLVPIPSSVGKMVTQGALLLALVLALTINPRGNIRPNLFLGLYSLLAVTSLMMSVRFVSIGTDYRAVRLILFIVVLWLLTPWWGRRDFPLLRNQLRVLMFVVGSVIVGAVVAHHKAFSYGGGNRLAGVIWPMPSPQVAHYAAELVGLSAILWMCGMVSRRWALVVIIPSAAVLYLAHTRTAVIAMVVALFVAALSLFSSRRRVRRTFAAAVIVAAVGFTGFSPLLQAYLHRGQSAHELVDLSGRTKTWSMLLAHPQPEPNTILGNGLSNDSFDGLSIDDSWLATYQDQGVVGDVIEATIVLSLLFTALVRPRGPARAMALFLVVYCLLASFTETGLTNATTYLVDLFLAASLLAVPRSEDAMEPLLLPA
jgi:hypothetical protein